MVDPYQLVLGIVAVFIMVLVPILTVFAYDLLAGRWDEKVQHWRNVRALRKVRGAPIERIAADLRRLRALVLLDTGRSAAQQMGALIAYDRVLTDACTMLSIEHGLTDSAQGLDREIERLRIEGELEGAGLVLSDHRHGQDQDAA